MNILTRYCGKTTTYSHYFIVKHEYFDCGIAAKQQHILTIL